MGVHVPSVRPSGSSVRDPPPPFSGPQRVLGKETFLVVATDCSPTPPPSRDPSPAARPPTPECDCTFQVDGVLDPTKTSRCVHLYVSVPVRVCTPLRDVRDPTPSSGRPGVPRGSVPSRYRDGPTRRCRGDPTRPVHAEASFRRTRDFKTGGPWVRRDLVRYTAPATPVLERTPVDAQDRGLHRDGPISGARGEVPRPLVPHVCLFPTSPGRLCRRGGGVPQDRRPSPLPGGNRETEVPSHPGPKTPPDNPPVPTGQTSASSPTTSGVPADTDHHDTRGAPAPAAPGRPPASRRPPPYPLHTAPTAPTAPVARRRRWRHLREPPELCPLVPLSQSLQPPTSSP